MILSVLILIVGIYLFYSKLKTRNIKMEQRTITVTALLSKFLLIAPLIGIAVFTILLTTLLQGRIVERSSHAFILFVLWMYATSFYVELLKHYKNKTIVMVSAIGAAMAATLAIMLTPLARYYTLLYSYLHGYTFLLGFFILALFYIGYLIVKK